MSQPCETGSSDFKLFMSLLPDIVGWFQVCHVSNLDIKCRFHVFYVTTLRRRANFKYFMSVTLI